VRKNQVEFLGKNLISRSLAVVVHVVGENPELTGEAPPGQDDAVKKSVFIGNLRLIRE
jgi:hypothetical protein